MSYHGLGAAVDQIEVFTPPGRVRVAKVKSTCPATLGSPLEWRHPKTGACATQDAVLQDPAVAARYATIKAAYVAWLNGAPDPGLGLPGIAELNMELNGVAATTAELADYIETGKSTSVKVPPTLPPPVTVAAGEKASVPWGTLAAVAVAGGILFAWSRR
jgi:hypothetical protein